ncbi:MAG: tetratricopeptide repeat protein [Acidobacteriota bacterium]
MKTRASFRSRAELRAEQYTPRMAPALSLRVFLGSLAASVAVPSLAQDVTFSRDVAPIFYERCVLCHRANDVAPMSLVSWEDARPWARSIARQVASRRMPPFHAEPGDFAFANDVSLSQEEIDTVVAWVEQGASEGDPSTLPDLPDFEQLSAEHRLGPADAVLEARESFVLEPGSDLQRAFVLENPYDEDVWLAAIDYDTRSPAVHHLLAVTDPTGQAKAFDTEDPGAGFAVSLTGGEGSDRLMSLYMNGASFLGSWAPGWVARSFGDDVGIRLRRGHDIVLQIHYWNGTDETIEHRPQVGLYFNRQPVRRTLRSGGPAADPEIFIRAGDADARHTDDWIAPADLHVHSASPHMHFLGKSMHLSAVFPDGGEKVLLDVPRFRFEWQATYAYQEPVFLPKGTRVRMISVHDNSAANPDNPSSPPRDVTFGERSTDEMAECILHYTYVDEEITSPTDELERIDEYLETLTQTPNDARLRLHVGRLLVAAERTDESIEHLAAATRLAPDYLPAGEALAGALERLGNLEAAAAELERLVARAPNAHNVALELARIEERTGKSSAAVARYTALATNADAPPLLRARAHFRTGNVLADRGEAASARREFRAAIALEPSLLEAHLNLATLLGRDRQFSGAFSSYETVVDLDPLHRAARMNLAIAGLLSGQDRAVVDRLEEGLELLPKDVEMIHLTARVLATSRDAAVRNAKRALELAQIAFASEPTPERAATLAMALAESGRFTEAVAVQQQLVQGMERASRDDLLPRARARLEAYERGEPCRAPWLSDSP